MSSSHAHEPAPMFTDQEKGLLVVVLAFIATAAMVGLYVFSTTPTKQWGEYANAGPIAKVAGAAPEHKAAEHKEAEHKAPEAKKAH